jgi:hypothetical protein
MWLSLRNSFVGVSLLAIAVCQPTFLNLTYRYREQAHSYRGLAVVLEDFVQFSAVDAQGGGV